MTKQYRNEALAAAHETAFGLTEAGVMSKRTMRAFDEACLTPVVEMTPEEIRELRLRERASQAVFARYLNVTTGLVTRRKAAKGRFVEAANPGGEKRSGCCSVTASIVATRSAWIAEPNPRYRRILAGLAAAYLAGHPSPSRALAAQTPQSRPRPSP